LSTKPGKLYMHVALGIHYEQKMMKLVCWVLFVTRLSSKKTKKKFNVQNCS